MSDTPTVLWLASPSLGRVLRALERLQRAKPTLPPEWHLSSPCPPSRLRLLYVALPGDDWQSTGMYLSRALLVPVTGLHLAAPRATWARWEQGRLIEQVELPASPPLTWWQRLPGVPTPPKAWQVWAQSEQLPILSLPPRKTIAHRTVASLERKDLLVERAGTWYALTLSAAIQ